VQTISGCNIAVSSADKSVMNALKYLQVRHLQVLRDWRSHRGHYQSDQTLPAPTALTVAIVR